MSQNILELFRFRCVVCFEQATDTHEIIPRSLDPHTWNNAENQVALCRSCHRRVHDEGTRKWKPLLRFYRTRALDILQR